MNANLKQLHTKCSNFLDDYFTEKFFDSLPIKQKNDRIGELYFTEKFIDDGIIDTHISNEGLDVKLKNISRPARLISDGWAEYVCSHPDEVNGLPVKFLGNDEDELLVRIRNVIRDKNKKIQDDINNGLVKPNEPVILCVNLDQIYDNGSGYDMMLMDKVAGNLPSVIRTVYPIGKLTAIINLSNPNKSKICRSYNKYIIRAKNGYKIEQTAFLNKKYSKISAILFNANKYGKKFILVHNYFAKNPIRRQMFSNCIEYIPKVEPCIGGKCLSFKEILNL